MRCASRECQTLMMIQGFRDNDYVQVIREVCPESAELRIWRTTRGKATGAAAPHLSGSERALSDR